MVPAPTCSWRGRAVLFTLLFQYGRNGMIRKCVQRAVASSINKVLPYGVPYQGAHTVWCYRPGTHLCVVRQPDHAAASLGPVILQPGDGLLRAISRAKLHSAVDPAAIFMFGYMFGYIRLLHQNASPAAMNT